MDEYRELHKSINIKRAVIASEALHRMVYRAKHGNLRGLRSYFIPRNDNLSTAFMIENRF